MSKYVAIKEELYLLAGQLISERLNQNKLVIKELRESAGSETKSSAGDKHETGRAMVHLEQEKMAQQLANNQSIKNVLDQIDPKFSNSSITFGSLVITDKLRFFISTALGKIQLNGFDYHFVSKTSPLAIRFIGKKKGNTLKFNGREYIIIETL